VHAYGKNDVKHVFIANFMKNPKHQLSPINFILFNQMTKTDFCSSPALKQFTIHYSIDEMLKTYVLLWCIRQLHLDFYWWCF